jgi:isocitrate dehydrogenase
MSTPATSRITVAHGDGVGPEIMKATLRVLDAAGAKLELDEVRIGQAVYESGVTSGIGPEVWDSLRQTGCFLKAPITTPQGGGYKSLNVTTRKTLGLFANVRPCASYAPFVRSKHPGMDLVIVRENEEDTYAGIEHQQTDEVAQCLKLITRPGSERIVRYAFDYAVANGRRKVTCMTKDNIMKLTDGLFRRVFEEISEEYPQIETDHLIIDIGTARMADSPEMFDVVVTPNLYGDILSDVAAQVAGSVGLAPSSNIGKTCAMFEAIHGSAPDIAGKGIANPSGLLLAGVMMLRHLGQGEVAAKVHNAWLTAVEEGVRTGDMKPEHEGSPALGTADFTDAVIARLGQTPNRLPTVEATSISAIEIGELKQHKPSTKELVGVDVFLRWDEAGRSPDAVADALNRAAAESVLSLKMLSNRGVKVWPDGLPETFCTDHWRCRFTTSDGKAIEPTDVIHLLSSIDAAGLTFIKTEHLYRFDGKPAYALGQGE